MSPRVDFIETARRWRGAIPARALARQAIAAAAAESGAGLRRGAEVSVHLIDDAGIRARNKQWRGRDAATNVLSFPAVEPGRLGQAKLLGDILLAFETVSAEAEAENKPLADHFRHLVAHGFLHLLGFDHVEDAEAELMEAMETRILASIGVPDPYAEVETVEVSI
jgi:probable rRNA maturation factor